MNNKGKLKRIYLFLILITFGLGVGTGWGIHTYKRMKNEAWFWVTTGIVSNTYVVVIKNGMLYERGPRFDPLISMDLKDIESNFKRYKNANRKRYIIMECLDDKVVTKHMSKVLYDLAEKYFSSDSFIIEDCNFEETRDI
jgi:hypothetical protein